MHGLHLLLMKGRNGHCWPTVQANFFVLVKFGHFAAEIVNISNMYDLILMVLKSLIGHAN